MKIENIGQIKEVEQIQVISEYQVPKFTEGQILIAKVEYIQGDKVMLKNKEGQMFMALMQSELGLAEGDMVEVAANRNGVGYVLHLLDIETANTQNNGMARDMLTGTLAAMKANPGIDPKSASFLIENNIPRTPENIAALARLVHGDSSLGSLLADILSGLDMPDLQRTEPWLQGAAQAPQPQANPEANAAAGGNAARAGEAAEQANTVAPQAITGEGETAAPVALTADTEAQTRANEGIDNAAGNNNDKAGTAVTGKPAAEGAPAPTAQAGPAATERADVQKASAQTENAAQAMETAAVPKGDAKGTIPVQSVPAEPAEAGRNSAAAAAVQNREPSGEPQTISKEGLPAGPENAAGELRKAAADGSAPPAEKDAALVDHAIIKEEITDRILSMFCKPDKQTAAEFKKTILGMPDELNSLKLLLHQSDKQDKGILLQKADQAQKQLELMSESKRFDCIQIPFMLKNGAERTAELYVYRHKRNQKESGENGLTVLVALDTQHIGRVETLMKTDGKNMALEFRLERKEVQPEIIKRSKALAKAMETAGYTLKSLRITGLETRTTVLNAGGVLIPDAGISPGNIDIQI